MQAKDELFEYYHKKNDGRKILEQYREYLDKATKVTSMISETSARTNLPSDKVGNNVVMMADLSIKYFDMFLDAEEYRMKIISKLLSLPRPYKEILWYKFIDELTFNQIAQLVKYSPIQTKRLYKKALYEYSKR